jgi:hypothetical protein
MLDAMTYDDSVTERLSTYFQLLNDNGSVFIDDEDVEHPLNECPVGFFRILAYYRGDESNMNPLSLGYKLYNRNVDTRTLEIALEWSNSGTHRVAGGSIKIKVDTKDQIEFENYVNDVFSNPHKYSYL